MIDIIIVTKADRGISKETLFSLVKYAQKERVILNTGLGVDWMAGERITDFRLAEAKKVTAEWVYFLDDDDELLCSLPNVSLLDDYDYILGPLVDKGRLRSLEKCSSYRVFGFHMILAKKEVAIATEFLNASVTITHEGMQLYI